MADELSARERALRRLPLPYSLALRLRDAGVAAEVICQYVNVERVALNGFYRIAEAKVLRRKRQQTAGSTSATDAADRNTFGPPRHPPPIVPTANDAGPCRLGR